MRLYKATDTRYLCSVTSWMLHKASLRDNRGNFRLTDGGGGVSIARREPTYHQSWFKWVGGVYDDIDGP